MHKCNTKCNSQCKIPVFDSESVWMNWNLNWNCAFVKMYSRSHNIPLLQVQFNQFILRSNVHFWKDFTQKKTQTGWKNLYNIVDLIFGKDNAKVTQYWHYIFQAQWILLRGLPFPVEWNINILIRSKSNFKQAFLKTIT